MLRKTMKKRVTGKWFPENWAKHINATAPVNGTGLQFVMGVLSHSRRGMIDRRANSAETIRALPKLCHVYWTTFMKSKASTVTEYLDQLPEDRRAAIEAVRK